MVCRRYVLGEIAGRSVFCTLSAMEGIEVEDGQHPLIAFGLRDVIAFQRERDKGLTRGPRGKGSSCP